MKHIDLVVLFALSLVHLASAQDVTPARDALDPFTGDHSAADNREVEILEDLVAAHANLHKSVSASADFARGGAANVAQALHYLSIAKARLAHATGNREEQLKQQQAAVAAAKKWAEAIEREVYFTPELLDLLIKAQIKLADAQLKWNAITRSTAEANRRQPAFVKDDVGILEQLVAALAKLQREASVRATHGFEGGEFANAAKAHYYLSIAKARLAYVKGDFDGRLKQQQAAVAAAKKLVEITKTMYEIAQTIPLDVVIEARIRHAEARLAMNELKRSTPAVNTGETTFDKDDVEIIKELVAARTKLHKLISARHQRELPGGEAANVAHSLYYLSAARGRLARVKGELETQLKEQQAAVAAAKKWVESTNAMYEIAQTIPLDVVIEAQSQHAEARLQLNGVGKSIARKQKNN